MNKTIELLNTILFLTALFAEEMAKERARTGLTDAELLDDAKLQVQANEVLALSLLTKYNTPPE